MRRSAYGDVSMNNAELDEIRGKGYVTTTELHICDLCGANHRGQPINWIRIEPFGISMGQWAMTYWPVDARREPTDYALCCSWVCLRNFAEGQVAYDLANAEDLPSRDR